MYLKLIYSVLLIIFLSLVLQAKLNKAYVPEGYIGCFVDYPDRILRVGMKVFKPNSGHTCKIFCKGQGYRYAGTENSYECFCGNKIRVKRSSNGCNNKCHGNSSEFCGGSWRISIYDTWHCVTKPCRNSATCMDIDANNFKCTCTDEWTGRHCDNRRPPTAIQSTSTTTKTATSTTDTMETTTASDESTDGTSKNSKSNVTDIPYLKPTDDHSSSMIAVYVLLPLGVIVILIIIAIFLKQRQKLKREPISEVISHGPGSVPNIYANLTASQQNQFQHGVQSHYSEVREEACLGKKLSAANKGKGETEEQEMVEYNTLSDPSNNREVVDNSYDHIVKPINFVDNTYSKMSAVKLDTEHMSVNDTYSHIKSAAEQNHINSITDKDVNTYNTLELKANRTPDGGGGKIEDSSLYDHTNKRQKDKTIDDYYSNMNETIAHPNDNSKRRSIGVESIYYNEDEYATVEKISIN